MKKKYSVSLFMFGLVLILNRPNYAGDFALLRPDGGGLLLVGTRQDAAQISASGVGLGAEIFLNYRISSRFSLDAATGIFTVTDDIFYAQNLKTVLMPSVEIRMEYRVNKEGWLRPFIQAGINWHGASSRVRILSEMMSSGYRYETGILLGIGTRLPVGRTSFELILSSDYCHTFNTSVKVDPAPKYWVMKCGISYDFTRSLMQTNSEKTVTDFSNLGDESFFSSSVSEMSGLDSSSIFIEDSSTDVFTRLDFLEKDLKENSQNIDQLLGRLQSVEERIGSVPKILTGTDVTNGSFITQYQKGLNLFQKADYKGAKSIFDDLGSIYPSHNLASNCHYWIGECLFGLRQYDLALQAFDLVLEYKVSYKLDDALLKKGLCYMNMGNDDLARTNLTELIQQYPDSEYISRAKRYIERL